MSTESWGRTAYRHATTTLVIGMSNQPYRVKETGGWSKTSTLLVRRQPHQWVKNGSNWVLDTPKNARQVDKSKTTHEGMLEAAQRAAQYRAGNCAEHAAVAYAYLYEKARGSGIGLVSRVSCKKPGDHAFVVIGRDPKGDGSVASWGAKAVIVDAWGRFVCYGSDIVGTSGKFIAGEDINVQGVQEYIKANDAYIRCEFDADAKQA